jgi:ribosome production factor 1
MAKGKVGAGAQKLKGIKCKAKRIEVFQKLKKEGDTQNRKDRKKRQKDAEALGDDAPDLKLQQKTLDNTREVDETIVGADDPDIAAEDSFDEFAGHFLQQLPPRTVVTTSMNPSKYIEEFLAEMVELLPNSEYRKRGKCPVKEMCDAAVKRGFTNLLIFTEDNTKKSVVMKEAPVTGLWVVKLPYGPTARFKLTTLVMPKKIRGHGTPTGHRPELILNNFNTRLGHRMGRMLACLFPYDPQFKGRQVVTLHNQRDFVFFRHHRYVFEQAAPGREVKSTLQELGPRFTLKLKSLQLGIFDTQHGDVRERPYLQL